MAAQGTGAGHRGRRDRHRRSQSSSRSWSAARAPSPPCRQAELRPEQAGSPAPQAPPRAGPDGNTPLAPAAGTEPGDAHAHRGGAAAAGAQGGRRLPRLHAGRQGIDQCAAVLHRRPAEVHHGRHQHRPGGLQARRRCRGAGRLRLLAGQQAAVVQPGLRAVQRDPGQDVHAGRAGDHRGDLDRDGFGAALPAAAAADRAGHLQPGRAAGQSAFAAGAVHPEPPPPPPGPCPRRVRRRAAAGGATGCPARAG